MVSVVLWAGARVVTQDVSRGKTNGDEVKA